MAHITIKIGQLGDGVDYIQYDSVMAVITIDKEEYVLESRDLDNDDSVQDDLYTICSFTDIWSDRAETDGIRCEVDDTVNDRIVDLNMELDEDDIRDNAEADMPGGFFD